MKLTESYHDDLIARLRKDRAFAVAYLNMTLNDKDSGAFLVALRNVVEAYGFKRLAGKAHVSREHLFRSLSKKGNPTLNTLRSITGVLGFGLAMTQKTPLRKAA